MFVIENGVLLRYQEEAPVQEAIVPEGVTEIGEEAFMNSLSLQKVILPEGLRRIGKRAFQGCKALQEICLPSSLTDIGAFAFYQCEQLVSVRLPDGVQHIREGTFTRCRALREITLPAGLNEIGKAAFRMCHALTEVHLPAAVRHVKTDAFFSCAQLARFTVSEDNPYLTAVGGVLYSKDKTVLLAAPTAISNIRVLEETKQLAPSCMNACVAVEHITVPGTLEVIEHGALPDGFPCLYITMPDGVISVNMSRHKTDWSSHLAHEEELLLRFLHEEQSRAHLFQCLIDTAYKLALAEYMAVHHPAEPFTSYAQRYGRHIARDCIEEREAGRLSGILEAGLVTPRSINDLLEFAAAQEAQECFVLLMEYKDKTIGFTDQKRRFSL